MKIADIAKYTRNLSIPLPANKLNVILLVLYDSDLHRIQVIYYVYIKIVNILYIYIYIYIYMYY